MNGDDLPCGEPTADTLHRRGQPQARVIGHGETAIPGQRTPQFSQHLAQIFPGRFEVQFGLEGTPSKIDPRHLRAGEDAGREPPPEARLIRLTSRKPHPDGAPHRVERHR
jgi:hypothetical protein